MTGIVVGGAMGGASAAASGRNVWEGVAEGALIGGVSSAIGFMAPPAAALYAAGSGFLIDAAFQAGEQLAETGTVSIESYDITRGVVATGGALLNTVGLAGLNPATSVTDASCAALISSDITMVYGCADIAISGIRSRNDNKSPVFSGGGTYVMVTK